MLKVQVPTSENYDEERNEFVTNYVELEFEHSLVTLSKWESVTEKPFLSNEEKTPEETLDYLIIMCKTPNVPRDFFLNLSDDNLKQINEYINGKHSATWFRELTNQPRSREIITAEIIYHWMIALQIPLECEQWHLARLFTLIKVVNQKNQKPQKMSRREALAERHRLNQERRQKLGTRG